MDRKTIEEEWRPVEGTNGKYDVSNFGRVRTNSQRPGLLTLTKQASGYLYAMVELANGKPKNCRVNRLVAQHFLPNPDNLPEVNHIDGNKENNHVSNLEWSNRSENMKHAIRTGLADPKKSAHHWTEEEREMIRQRQIAYLERTGRRAKPRRTWAEYQAERKAKAEARKAERLALKASQPPKRRGRPPKHQTSGPRFI